LFLWQNIDNFYNTDTIICILLYLVNGTEIVPEAEAAKVEQMTGKAVCPEEAKKGTIAYSIMKAHNTADSMDNLRIKFDAMTFHDITFVGIIQTASSRSSRVSSQAAQAATTPT